MISKKIESLRGLVLAVTPYKDDSAIATFACENGIFSILLRGVYKPKSLFKSMLLIFNYVEVNVYKNEDNFFIATQASSIKDISNIYLDYKSNVTLTFLQELTIDLFQYGDNFPLIEYNLFLKALEEKKDILTILLLIVGEIYKVLGLKMDTEECINCLSKKNIVSYSISDGGFYCKKCSPIEKVDSMYLYILKFSFLGFNEVNVNKMVPKEFGKKIFLELIENLIDYFDLKKLSSLSMLLSILD